MREGGEVATCWKAGGLAVSVAARSRRGRGDVREAQVAPGRGVVEQVEDDGVEGRGLGVVGERVAVGGNGLCLCGPRVRRTHDGEVERAMESRVEGGGRVEWPKVVGTAPCGAHSTSGLLVWASVLPGSRAVARLFCGAHHGNLADVQYFNQRFFHRLSEKKCTER